VLEGYVITNIGGGWMIGRLKMEEKDLPHGKAIRRYLDPVYEVQVQYIQDPRGNVGMQCVAMPILGSPNFRSIDLPPTAVFLKCEDMSQKEKERWSQAIQVAEDFVKQLKTAEAGIVLAPAGAKLPSAESLGLVSR